MGSADFIIFGGFISAWFQRLQRGAGMRSHVAALFALTLSLAVVGAPTASAATPTNDNLANATAVTALPFSDGVTTTDATTEATDPLTCSGAAHSVWYAYTPTSDGYVTFNTFGSDFDTVLAAFTGSPGTFNQVACNDDSGSDLQSSIIFAVTSGTTYSIMASGCCGDTVGESGALVLNADASGPPFTFQVSVSSKGTVNPKTGTATIYGTAVCSQPGYFHNDDGVVSQRIGRARISAYPYEEFACGPQPVSWSMQVTPYNGLFVAGTAQLQYFEWHGFTPDFTQDARQFDDPMAVKLVNKR